MEPNKIVDISQGAAAAQQKPAEEGNTEKQNLRDSGGTKSKSGSKISYNKESESMKIMEGYHATRVTPVEISFHLPVIIEKRFICPVRYHHPPVVQCL